MRTQIRAHKIARNEAGVSERRVTVTSCFYIGESKSRSDSWVVHNRSSAGVKVAEDVKVSSLDAASFNGVERRQLLTERIFTIGTRNIGQPVRPGGDIEWR